jgi:hypothetical protein
MSERALSRTFRIPAIRLEVVVKYPSVHVRYIDCAAEVLEKAHNPILWPLREDLEMGVVLNAEFDEFVHQVAHIGNA